jgi:hypothetical protein
MATRSTVLRQRSVGIFWDIENLQVRRDANIRGMVAHVRSRFVQSASFSEKMFVVVGNVRLIPPEVAAAFCAVNVELCHVEQDKKNAADVKITAKINEFMGVVEDGVRPRVVLLTSDVHFKDVLYDLKLRRGVETVLIYRNARHELLDFADALHTFEDFFRDFLKGSVQRNDLPEVVAAPNGQIRYKLVPCPLVLVNLGVKVLD